MINSRSKKELNIFMAWGFLLGILCYFALYGFYQLDVTYDRWIFWGDLDIKQHYVGWIAYRMSDWKFPFCMTDKISYPTPMSIVYTDSIPLFAIFFKIFSGILPETFQYFGIYALLCYALQGALSCRILSRFVKNNFMVCVLPVCFVFSTPMLERIFYHTSLGAQWLILLCIELWISGLVYKSYKNQLLAWGAVAALCILIHTYFLPMCLCIMCGAYLEKLLNRCTLEDVIELGGVIVTFMLVAVIVLHSIGGFCVSVSGDIFLGDFNMNLNSFFDSRGHSLFLPALPTYSTMQYEGEAYLGLGMIIALVVALSGFLYGLFDSRYTLVSCIKGHTRRISILVVSIILIMAASLPLLSLGSMAVTIPYPSFLYNIAGIFRSNGRFVWPVIYMIYFVTAAGVEYFVNCFDRIGGKKYVIAFIALLLIVVQIIDLSPWLSSKYDKYHEYEVDTLEERNESFWGKLELEKDYDRFICFVSDNNVNIRYAYYALNKGMTINRFYFARDIADYINGYLDEQLKKFDNQEFDENVVYVFDEPAYNLSKDCGLRFKQVDSVYIGVK